MYLCMCIYMCMCMYVCMCIYVCIFIVIYLELWTINKLVVKKNWFNFLKVKNVIFDVKIPVTEFKTKYSSWLPIHKNIYCLMKMKKENGFESPWSVKRHFQASLTHCCYNVWPLATFLVLIFLTVWSGFIVVKNSYSQTLCQTCIRISKNLCRYILPKASFCREMLFYGRSGIF